MHKCPPLSPADVSWTCADTGREGGCQNRSPGTLVCAHPGGVTYMHNYPRISGETSDQKTLEGRPRAKPRTRSASQGALRLR
eukprot:701425-Alexandrium_andersonii.AAC.1